MGNNLKPVTPLTDVQAKNVADLLQKAAGIRKILADAQTEFAATQLAYSVAMDKFKAENDPLLRDAQSKFDDVNNKMGFELSTIELALRDIRTVESATDVVGK